MRPGTRPPRAAWPARSLANVDPLRVPAPEVDEASLRRALGRFATGVCVATTVHREVDHAMTVSAFTSVSLEPPLVLVCVELEARFHEAVTASGLWAVSVLQADARPAAEWLSTRGRPLHGQLNRVPHRRGPLTGAALLEQSLAAMECRTEAIHPGGDHSIVVGEVIGVWIRANTGGPLLYHRGDYRHLK